MSVREQLDANIPREAISTRSAGGGKQLSYLEGWFVIDRLNKVLGQGNWQYEVIKLEKTIDREVANSNGKVGRGVAYLATIQLTADIDEQVVQFSDVGAGKGIDYNYGLEADESAAKEAVTDGLKRCAKNLGMSMGLALYDKTQEYVDDQPSDRVDKNAAKAGESISKLDNRRSDTSVKSSPSTRSGDVDSKVLKGQIKNAFAVLQAQKKITKEDFVKDYTAGVKVDDLAESAVAAVLSKLKQNFPDLGL